MTFADLPYNHELAATKSETYYSLIVADAKAGSGLNQESNEASLFELRNDKATMGIIKPKPKDESPYHKLYCDATDRQNINELIKNMAEHGKIWLLRHRSFMNEIGDSIRHIHPLKLLEVIFTDSFLTQCMREVFDDYFKRNGFMEGLGESLTLKSKTGDLSRYMHDFAKAVLIPFDELQGFFESMDWESLMRYLMNKNSQKEAIAPPAPNGNAN